MKIATGQLGNKTKIDQCAAREPDIQQDQLSQVLLGHDVRGTVLTGSCTVFQAFWASFVCNTIRQTRLMHHVDMPKVLDMKHVRHPAASFEMGMQHSDQQ